MTPKTKNVLTFFASFAGTAAVLGAISYYALIPYMKIDVGPDQTGETRLFQIAKVYLFYAGNDDPAHLLPAKPGAHVHEVALLFAQKYGLTESKAWLADRDALLVGHAIPRLLAMETKTGLAMEPKFGDLPLGFELVANVPLDAPKDTPIAWSRGLRPDGAWSADSPYAGLGGYMAFLDGHVEWFTQLGKKGTQIHKYGTQTPTTDVREALPPGAVILSAAPMPIIPTLVAEPRPTMK